MKVSLSWTVAFLTLFSTHSFAADAPAGLRNKTLSLSWGVATSWRRLSDNKTGTASFVMATDIYVSSAGRAFAKYKGVSNAGVVGGGSESGPERTASKISFSGNTMTVFAPRGGLLLHITASVDPSYSSCSATVSVARDGAKAKTTGIDGAPYENLSAQAGSPSCSIRDGNAFAG